MNFKGTDFRVVSRFPEYYWKFLELCELFTSSALGEGVLTDILVVNSFPTWYVYFHGQVIRSWADSWGIAIYFGVLTSFLTWYSGGRGPEYSTRLQNPTALLFRVQSVFNKPPLTSLQKGCMSIDLFIRHQSNKGYHIISYDNLHQSNTGYYIMLRQHASLKYRLLYHVQELYTYHQHSNVILGVEHCKCIIVSKYDILLKSYSLLL